MGSPHGSSLQYLILLFFEQMLESFKPLEEGKNVNLAFSISSPWLQSPVHRPAISRQKPTQTGSRRARLFHTNFKQVMYRQGERERGKNRFREKPNTIEAKKTSFGGKWDLDGSMCFCLFTLDCITHAYLVCHSKSKKKHLMKK